jgi:hypothetical protein
MTSNDVLDMLTKDPQLVGRNRLALSVFIDLGLALAGGNDGFIDVQAYRTINDMPVIYRNVEVLYPAGVHMDLSNALLMVLVPCSCVPDTQTGEILNEAYPYDGRGVKAIPLSNSAPSNSEVLPTFYKDSFTVGNKDYSFNFLKNAISLSMNNLISASVTPDQASFQWKNALSFVVNDGGVSKIFWDADGKITKMVIFLADGTETTYIGAADELTVPQMLDPSTYTKWKWIITKKADGSMSYVQNDNGTKLNEITLSDSGELSLKHKNKEIKVDDNGISLEDANGNKIVTSSDGIELSKGTSKVTIGSTIKMEGATGSVEIS